MVFFMSVKFPCDPKLLAQVMVMIQPKYLCLSDPPSGRAPEYFMRFEVALP